MKKIKTKNKAENMSPNASLSIDLTIFTISYINFLLAPVEDIKMDKKVLISPASGKVITIINRKNRTNIAIFLSPFDSHTQHIPYTGRVTKIERKVGSNVFAFLSDAKNNNAVDTYLSTRCGLIKIRQSTGFFFRRIVNNFRVGQKVKKRQEMGRILFGSRVEIEFPSTVFQTSVAIGQKVEGGKTIIAKRVRKNAKDHQ